MKTPEEANALARSLVDTGKRMGVATTALVTDMNQPLGRLAGNAIEIDESVACLEGEGPEDLREITVKLGGELLCSAGLAADSTEGETKIAATLDDGSAREKLAEMVRAQGGDLEATRPRGKEQVITATEAGVVSAVDTELLGYAVIELGGGRKVKEDLIDPKVGFDMLVRLGDQVEIGQPLVKLFVAEKGIETAERMGKQAIQVNETIAEVPSLVLKSYRLVSTELLG